MSKTSLLALALAACSLTAFAQDATTTPAANRAEWLKNHPRRAEVNARLANQRERIHNEVQSGEITKSQAAALHAQDHQIRQEERIMASQNGGHITRLEKRTLNQQENKLSAQIGK
jgi:Skp family chaperone for outer membrane proteins